MNYIFFCNDFSTKVTYTIPSDYRITRWTYSLWILYEYVVCAFVINFSYYTKSIFCSNFPFDEKKYV